ncbi:hypothetical protein AVEN_158760-1 [Araneus ventricosus]|uniref:Uncharacterized protein n=1 Tax=Araneus ventricosus TaxID=182803 RepID=A0A4Y2MKQ4_ARAVE|nr:hypothetical protein AVEN_158760-1 [Araneus ventricosus]
MKKFQEVELFQLELDNYLFVDSLIGGCQDASRYQNFEARIFHQTLQQRRSTSSSPQLDQVQVSARPQKISNTIGERFMAKEESAASVGTRPWTPEGRSLTWSIAFMLLLGIMEWPSRLG